MKKVFVIIFFCFFLLSFTSNKDINLNGYIRMKGNDPFAFPVIKTEDGKEYQIKSDNYTLETFVKLQGYKIEFTGHIEAQKAGDDLIYYFFIESYQII